MPEQPTKVPIPARVDETSPEEYMPAGMLRAFVYCPRLFFYEYVDEAFTHNAYTLEGEFQHRRVHRDEQGFPSPEEIADGAHSTARSVRLSSDRYGLTAVMDLIETKDGLVRPVEYKRGRPRRLPEGGVEPWLPEKAQVVAHVLILRDNGYRCDHGIIYYAATRQRLEVPVGPEEEEWIVELVDKARKLAESRKIPPPLLNSPKCDGCSLAPVCLPDETWLTAREIGGRRFRQRALFDDMEDEVLAPPDEPLQIRPLAVRDSEAKPLYVNTQGARVKVTSRRLIVELPDGQRQEFLCKDVSHVAIFGNVQCTTQALRQLMNENIPVAFFTYGGYFQGLLHGLNATNALLRHEQHVMAEKPWFCLEFSRSIVAGKIENQRVILQRNHPDPPQEALAFLKHYARQAREAEDVESLRGIEGAASRLYFQHFQGLIKRGRDEEARRTIEWTFDFRRRNRRPPLDPVNALLSFAYSILCKDLTITCQIVGLDPYLGFFHSMRHRRPALALDLMEPFRPIIADAVVYTAINRGMIKPHHFVRAGKSVNLNDEGRKAFFRAYEQRMTQRVTHPLFGYQVTYRALLELQTRLLARYIRGELSDYPVFRVR